jgi:hypothetical protein
MLLLLFSASYQIGIPQAGGLKDIRLAAMEIKSYIHEKGTRGQALNEMQKR